MANPQTYMGSPWGDAPIDYMFNSKGMMDAANQLGIPTPIQSERFILKRQQAEQLRDAQFPKDF